MREGHVEAHVPLHSANTQNTRLSEGTIASSRTYKREGGWEREQRGGDGQRAKQMRDGK